MSGKPKCKRHGAYGVQPFSHPWHRRCWSFGPSKPQQRAARIAAARRKAKRLEAV